MVTTSAVAIEEGRVGNDVSGVARSAPNTTNRIRSLFGQFFSPPFASNRANRRSRTIRNDSITFRRPRPQPINVQRTLEIPIVHMPFHVHRDSFVFKKKKKGPSSLHFIFDSNMKDESDGKTLSIGLFYKNEQLDIVEAERNCLKQNLAFRDLSNDMSSIGKALKVVVEGNEFKHITKLELVQSINGFIVARIYSQQVFGKHPDGSPFSHYLQDIYCQPYSILLKGQNNLPLFSKPDPNISEDDEEDDKKSEINRECIICLSEKRDTIVLPCRHMCLCAECAGLLSNRADRCPICREGCQALLQISEFQPHTVMGT